MRRLQAGKLRHLVELQAPVYQRDKSGGFKPLRVDDASYAKLGERFASIEPFQVRERFQSSQYHGEVSHRITVRDAADVSIGGRVKFGDRVFDIKGIRNIEERDRIYEILALERFTGVRDG